MEKRLVIGIAGSDGKEFHDVVVLPNTRAGEILNRLNLGGFQIAKQGGGFYSATDDIFETVADGQKLYVTPSTVEAGA